MLLEGCAAIIDERDSFAASDCAVMTERRSAYCRAIGVLLAELREGYRIFIMLFFRP